MPSMPPPARAPVAAGDTIKIGFLAPLTGPVAAWGKPGLDGCLIWADRINARGGVEIGGTAHKIEFVGYDDEYDAAKARAGATKLIEEDGVKFVMMLGGDTWPGVQKIAERGSMLFLTLLPSDLSPKTRTLVAPCEVHPICNVTGVEWLAENRKDLKTAAICAQDNVLGMPSVATYLAAFEAAGIEMVDKPAFFDPATTDFAALMTGLLAKKPDILCLDTCPTEYVHPLCEQAFRQGAAVQHGEMVQLVLRIEPHLPVGALLDPVGLDQLQFMERTAVDPLRDAIHVRVQRLTRIRAEMDENEAFPEIRDHRRQTMLPLVEVVEILFVGDGDQSALVVIRPAMKTAMQESPARAPFVGDQPVAAMRANIVKAAYETVGATDHQHGGAADGDIPHEIVARLRDLVDAPDIQPAPGKDPVAFQLEILLRNIRFGRNRGGAQLGIFLRPPLRAQICLHRPNRQRCSFIAAAGLGMDGSRPRHGVQLNPFTVAPLR